MEDQPQQDQASPAVQKRVQESSSAHLEAIGTVLKPGRTLTVCRLEVYGVQADGARADGVQADGARKLVANGQQTLIRVDRPAA